MSNPSIAFLLWPRMLPTPKLVRLGVQRIEDPYHPRGYRELRSPAEMRKLTNRKVREQGGTCAICHEDFTDYSDIVPDHKSPKGMGGGWRDDHPDNIQAHIGGVTKRRDQPEWISECSVPGGFEYCLKAGC
jgi:hypothetical protein